MHNGRPQGSVTGQSKPLARKQANGSTHRLTERTLSGLLWMFAGSGCQAILQLLVLGILARLLTPADFGLVTGAMVVIGLSSIVSKLGIGHVVIQQLTLEVLHLRTAFMLSLLLGAAMSLLIWLAAPGISGLFPIAGLTPIVRTMSLLLLIQSFSIVAESLLQRELRFRQFAAVEVITYAVGFGVVGVVMAFVGFGAWALVIAHLSYASLRSTGFLIVQPHPKRLSLEKSASKDLIYFGLGHTAGMMGNFLAAYGDHFVVGRWLGAEALGLYGRAYQLMAAPTSIFGQVIATVLFPAMASINDRPRRLRVAYRRAVALIALVMLPASVTLFILAPEVVHIVLGIGWSDVIVPFQILVVGILFRTSSKMSDSIAHATGAVYRRAWRQWLYAALVIGGAWLGSSWGVEGVALGVLGALGANFFLMSQLGLRLSNMTWWSFCAAHAPGAALSAIVGVEVWILSALLRDWGLSPLQVLGLSVGPALIAVPILFRYLPRLVLGRDGLRLLQILMKSLPAQEGRLHRFAQKVYARR